MCNWNIEYISQLVKRFIATEKTSCTEALAFRKTGVFQLGYAYTSNSR